MKNNLLKITLIIIFVFTVLLMLFTNSAYSGTVKSINVHKDSLVFGTKVLLGEISTIDGSLDGIQDVENIIICSAPSPKNIKVISRDSIFNALRKSGVLIDTINFNCPDKVNLRAGYIEFSRNDIKKIIIEHIRKNITWDMKYVQIKNIICRPVVLPQGEVSYRFSLSNNNDFIGSYNEEIIFVVDNNYRKKVRVSANIVVATPVVVSTKVIKRNSTIKPGDIKLLPRDITGISDHIFTDVNLLVGKKAKTRINFEKVIRKKMIGSNNVVKRGDIVTIHLENERLKLSVPARVLERGAVGDTIRVINISSDKEIYAVVKSSKTVEVSF
jgi:flagella basal body P-ring formation protein FlgA